MIALDTNALLRLVLEDEPEQAEKVRKAVLDAQSREDRVLILDGVLMEAAWVLRKGYGFERRDIAELIEALLSSDTYYFQDRGMLQRAAFKIRLGGDLADIMFGLIAKDMGAESMLSFDKKYQSLFPDFVREP
jgi:predicted nucleic-acid-binding protein